MFYSDNNLTYIGKLCNANLKNSNFPIEYRIYHKFYWNG